MLVCLCCRHCVPACLLGWLTPQAWLCHRLWAPAITPCCCPNHPSLILSPPRGRQPCPHRGRCPHVLYLSRKAKLLFFWRSLRSLTRPAPCCTPDGTHHQNPERAHSLICSTCPAVLISLTLLEHMCQTQNRCSSKGSRTWKEINLSGQTKSTSIVARSFRSYR